jgi:Hep_Hag./YadA-like C-terminal region./Haemagglutinin.
MASGIDSSAYGSHAVSAGSESVAVGVGASANGVGTVAEGAGAVASYTGSVAIGQGAKALADPTTAVGNNAIAQGNNSVALGANTTANGSNSVALGQGSVANRADSVSVGDASTGFSRQITNVAPGTMGTDAVNLNQMDAFGNRILQQGEGYTNAAVGGALREAYAGIAASLATPSIPVLKPGQKWIGMRMGTYGGQSATGVAFSYQINRRTNIGATIAKSYDGGPVAMSAQIGYAW